MIIFEQLNLKKAYHLDLQTDFHALRHSVNCFGFDITLQVSGLTRNSQYQSEQNH